MINENEFEEIFSDAKKYLYSSFTYLDYDECKFSNVIGRDADLILMLDKTKNPALIHYATNDYLKLIKNIDKIEISVKICFVEHAYKADLEKAGFETYAEYIDFFCTDLNSLYTGNTYYGDILFAKKDVCHELSLLSKKCGLGSRGFEGDPPEWFAEWMDENDVIIITDGAKKIIGYCCVAVFAEGTTLWIRELAVDPEHQGKGIAKKLMERATVYGKNKGTGKGFLAVDAANKKAIHLYRKYNFTNKSDSGELQMIRKGKSL